MTGSIVAPRGAERLQTTDGILRIWQLMLLAKRHLARQGVAVSAAESNRAGRCSVPPFSQICACVCVRRSFRSAESELQQRNAPEDSCNRT